MIPFLVPIFLGGIALVAAPWLIHRIRRPEREEVKFSSLMFVPKIPKEVIERRKLQHLLLMLLRMLVVLLLALLFGRPFYAVQEPVADLAVEAHGRHLILVDTSYSMSRGEKFSRAVRAVSRALDQIPQGDSVGLAAFDSGFRVEVPIEVGNPEAILARLRDLRPSHNNTQYASALLAAEAQLSGEPGGETLEPAPRVIHLVTDMQASGLARQPANSRLSSMVALRIYPVSPASGAPAAEVSVTEVGVRPLQGEILQVSGKLKNWLDHKDADLEVALMVEDEVLAQQQLKVSPGNATRVSFPLERPGSFAGSIRITGYGEALDHEGRFVWRPPRKPKVLLVTGNRAERFPVRLFLETGFAERWSLAVEGPGEWADQLLATAPDLLVLADVTRVDPDEGERLQTWLSQGGRLLAIAPGGVETGAWNDRLLAPLGLMRTGSRFAAVAATRDEMLTWLDFSHPSLVPFKGSRFNDFSSLRFNNYHLIQAQEGAQVTELARFQAGPDGVSWPAILETSIGKGRVLLWSFALNLDWSNLARNAKFIPLLQETADYLTGKAEKVRPYQVGEPYLAGNWRGQGTLVFPDQTPLSEDRVVLQQVGYLHLVDEGLSRPIEAINLDPEEMDPAVIAPRELALKLSSGTVTGEGGEGDAVYAEPQPARKLEAEETRKEWGQWFLLPLAVILLLETFYAAALSRRRTLVLKS